MLHAYYVYFKNLNIIKNKKQGEISYPELPEITWVGIIHFGGLFLLCTFWYNSNLKVVKVYTVTVKATKKLHMLKPEYIGK